MQSVTIGVGNKPLNREDAEFIRRSTIDPIRRGVILADNFGEIFTDPDRMAELQSSHIIACLRNRQEGIGDLDPYKDLGFFSDGFNSGLRITFSLYHAFRLVSHLGYTGASSPTYTLPEGFCPSSLGLEAYETENINFNNFQTFIISRTGYTGETNLKGYEPDQIIHAHDLGLGYGTAFMTECLAQRLRDFELEYYSKDIDAVLTA